jgi:hypothetical protein
MPFEFFNTPQRLRWPAWKSLGPKRRETKKAMLGRPEERKTSTRPRWPTWWLLLYTSGSQNWTSHNLSQY